MLLSRLLRTCLVAIAVAVVVSSSGSAQSGLTLQVSANSNRSAAVPLAGAEVSGAAKYVFLAGATGVTGVSFYLDDPNATGPAAQVEGGAPWDFAGTAANGTANHWDTRGLINGPHTITAVVTLANGSQTSVTAEFTVNNLPGSGGPGGPPGFAPTFQVSAKSDRSNPVPLAGGVVAGPRQHVFLTPAAGPSGVRFYLDDPHADGPAFTVEGKAPWDFAGTAEDGKSANAWDTRGLTNGAHTITAIIAFADGSQTSVTTEFTVNNQPKPCQALQCSDAMVALPYALDFGSDHGKVLDAGGIGTGFTYIDVPENSPGYLPGKLQMDTAAGELKIATTAGTQYLLNNDQDNALGVGVDAPNQITVVKTHVINPPRGIPTGGSEQVGLWFGNDEDNYVKLVILSTDKGMQMQALLETGGAKKAYKNSSILPNLPTSRVDLRLKANPVDRTVTFSYNLNNGTYRTLASFVVPPEMFSFDAAGIDPRIGTRTFTGILARHGNGAEMTQRFDSFSVTSETPPPPAPSSDGIAFERSTFDVGFPTSMVEGPDGRLYVSELFGTIHAFTLDAEKKVVADQVIETLNPRLLLGLTIDPSSTPSNVKLVASHSSPSIDNGEANSSTVTRLSGPSFANREDIVTGLPRAKANHAINSIHYGPDGRLYIAQGGNTGAGAPNTANTEFGTMREQPLSAAMLVADVNAPGFDGSCHNGSDIFGPPPCDVQVFASGLRNTYDFVHHSNGSIYGPNNGLGVTGTFPPSASPPCFGFGSTVSYQQGGQNPGDQPDGLNRIVQGRYYGHPNPTRNECIFGDGTFQNAQPLPNYTPPMHVLGLNKSTNGIIEYTDGTKFCGVLKGDMLVANYSVGDDITRLKLAADGLSVTGSGQLQGGLSDPLPMAMGHDGTVYVGETGGNRVSVLKPVDTGCWNQLASLPKDLLDVAGTALGGKFYLLAGKTPTTYERTMYIYDPATNAWTTGSEPPAVYPSVENPAVVAANGKLYMFGGQTDPFKGAVKNAAVYDPATQQWTMLPTMPTARGGAAAVAKDGKIWVIGGMASTGGSLTAVEVFDTATNTWSAAPPLGTRRDNPGAAVLQGNIYVFGGRTREATGQESAPTLETTEMFDATANVWVPKAPMPTGRRTFVVGLLRGRAQIMGGEKTPAGGTFPQNEEYDAATDTWRTLNNMKPGRHGAAAATIDGKVYVAGGGITGGGSYSGVHEAFGFMTP